jgi:hypothetical protein
VAINPYEVLGVRQDAHKEVTKQCPQKLRESLILIKILPMKSLALSIDPMLQSRRSLWRVRVLPRSRNGYATSLRKKASSDSIGR